MIAGSATVRERIVISPGKPLLIAKLGVVIEEADESAFWLEILGEAGIVRPAATKRLLNEADELTRIFVSSRETSRRNRRLRHRGDRH